MWMTARGTSREEERRGPSREEIETLCVLHAVGADGCWTGDLAERLGLSPSLAALVAGGMDPLIRKGWLEERNGRFVVTDVGQEWLSQRLAEWGVE